MGAIIEVLISAIVELVFWVIMGILPAVFFFTALALVFVVTFGRVAVEFPNDLAEVGWTGGLSIARSPQGRITLSPALGVVIGFITWAILVSACVFFYARS